MLFINCISLHKSYPVFAILRQNNKEHYNKVIKGNCNMIYIYIKSFFAKFPKNLNHLTTKQTNDIVSI